MPISQIKIDSVRADLLFQDAIKKYPKLMKNFSSLFFIIVEPVTPTIKKGKENANNRIDKLSKQRRRT